MIIRDKSARMEYVKAHLEDVLVDAEFPEIKGFGRGKVRDHYDIGGGRFLMVATDRQSAFDKILAAVPFKGQVLTSTARYWFEATKDIVANHVIDYPDPNVMLVRRLEMLPVEVVVRAYLTGSTSTSIWLMYRNGQRKLYGYDFPDGMKKNVKLPRHIITPTTKGGAGEHDVPISGEEIVARGLLKKEMWDELSETALALFARGQELAAKNGLILVDTKYEFGIDEKGKLTLADEIHTPDSSRYWRADSYEQRLKAGQEPDSLDKEFLRLWIASRCDPYREAIPAIPPETLADFSLRYIALYETISGKPFDFPDSNASVHDRIKANLISFMN
jgi:phosphoribosylaminoimidazole-succinocarboxamide synthase